MKIFKRLVTCLLCVCLLFSLTACSTTETLAAPTGFTISSENLLKWGVVAGAKNYEIMISGNGSDTQKVTKTNSYSLDLLEQGSYTIKVKAKGSAGIADSPWSEAVEFESNNTTGLIYRFTDNGEAYEISAVGRAEGDIVVEDVFNGKPVTKIGANAFKNSSKITSLTIGDNVTAIGDNAFYNCSKLETLVLPEALLSLGVAAFQSCAALKALTIPKYLTSVSENAFSYCKGLKTLDFSNAASLKTLERNAFTRCEGLEEIVLPDGVEEIADNVFSYCSGLKKITLNENLTSIGSSAFYKDELLEEIVFAKGGKLTSIGSAAFKNCSSLKSVVIPEGVTAVNSSCFENCSSLESVKLPTTIRSIGSSAFTATKLYKNALDDSQDFIFIDNWLIDCLSKYKETAETLGKDAFSAYEAKSGVKVVGIADSVFMGAKALTDVDLPSSVKYLGKYAFSSIETLKTFKAKDDAGHSLEIVGDGAFLNSQSLDDVQFDKNGHLKEIGSYAFYDCKGLIQRKNTPTRGVIIPSTVERVGSFAFKNTSIWTTASEKDMVYVDNWIVGWKNQLGAQNEYFEDMTDEEYNKLSEEDKFNVDQIKMVINNTWLASPTEITIKEGTVGIADYAFYHLYTQTIKGLDTLVEGTGKPIIIGEGAFYRCTNLDGVSLNSSLKSIPDFLFYMCENLSSITLPSELKSIGRSAFFDCKRLAEINFTQAPELKTIGDYAFSGCLNLQSPVFHLTGRKGSIETIGDYAFSGCKNKLVEANLPDALTSLGDYAFAYCLALEKIDYGKGIKTIPNYAFYNCVSLKSVVVPDTVTSVGNGAYFSCSSVEDLTISSSVEVIGDYAFAGLAVTNVTLPTSVKQIGNYAFRYNTYLRSLTIGSGVEYVGAHVAFGCSNLTFYLANADAPLSWAEKWNSSFRPVVYGCETDNGSYVLSFTVGENTFENDLSQNGITAPYREGYTFLGWATTENGEPVYDYSTVTDAPVGTVLYAVWTNEQ